ELKIVDIAGHLGTIGMFILPQGSTPFRYSGAQYYQRVDSAKFEKFFAETGIDIEAGRGIDTTFHRDAWRQTSIVTEIACCEFTQPVEAQGNLFDLPTGKAAA